MDLSFFSELTQNTIQVFKGMRGHALPQLQALTVAAGAIGLSVAAIKSVFEGNFQYTRLLIVLLTMGLVASVLQNFESIVGTSLDFSLGLANLARRAGSATNYFEDPSSLTSDVFKLLSVPLENASKRGIFSMTFLAIAEMGALCVAIMCTVAAALWIFYVRVRISFQALMCFLLLPLIIVPGLSAPALSMANHLFRLIVQAMTLTVVLNAVPEVISTYRKINVEEPTIQNAVLSMSVGPVIVLILFIGNSVGAQINHIALGTFDKTVRRAAQMVLSIKTMGVSKALRSLRGK